MALAAALAGLFCAHPASAQNITAVSGNGQLICQTCFSYSAMRVLVTDSNGVPQPNVTVNWQVASGGYGQALAYGQTTTTLYDGTSSNFLAYYVNPPQGSPLQQYLQNTVTASTTSNTVTFVLTEALYDPSNFSDLAPESACGANPDRAGGIYGQHADPGFSHDLGRPQYSQRQRSTGELPGPVFGAGGELRGSRRWRSEYGVDGLERDGHVLSGFRRCC
jgi:hypothetical protein